MARRRSPPKFSRHSSGQARVRIDGRVHYLGPYGSREALERYSRLIDDWRQSADCPPASLSIAQLTLLYFRRCRKHYRKADQETSEVSNVQIALRHLNASCRDIQAAAFTPKMLRTVRDQMVAAGYVRTSINRHIGRIRRMFKWAVSEELVPLNTFLALGTLQGLQYGRTEAFEASPVVPVPQAWIDAVEPYVSRPVRAMIRLQLATGMRPGEVRILRGCDLNMTGEVWEYRPASHKTEHHGKGRVVMIGPAGQAILREFLKTDLHEFLFSPRDATVKGNPGRCYTAYSYGRAIARACAEWGVPHWSPNRLRHNFATRARREFGIEAARVTLGHSSAVTSEIYAERDLEAARAVVAKIG